MATEFGFSADEEAVFLARADELDGRSDDEMNKILEDRLKQGRLVRERLKMNRAVVHHDPNDIEFTM